MCFLFIHQNGRVFPLEFLRIKRVAGLIGMVSANLQSQETRKWSGRFVYFLINSGQKFCELTKFIVYFI